MGTLTALLLATPLFGLTLTPPSSGLAPATEIAVQPASQMVLAMPAWLLEEAEAGATAEAGGSTSGEAEQSNAGEAESAGDAEVAEEAEEAGEASASGSSAEEEPGPVTSARPETGTRELPEPTSVPEDDGGVQEVQPTLHTNVPTPREAAASATVTVEEGGSQFERLQARGEERRQLRDTHMLMGVATWLSMAATLTLGTLTYVDKYGADSYEDTRCQRGTAIMGQWNCGTPYAHLFSVLLTTSLYAGTFGLSARMSADDDAGLEQRRRTDRRLRMHRTLRWVHLALMAAQLVEGLIFANLDSMGVDPQENHGTLRGLNGFHLGVGAATFTALTWAGIMQLAQSF